MDSIFNYYLAKGNKKEALRIKSIVWRAEYPHMRQITRDRKELENKC